MRMTILALTVAAGVAAHAQPKRDFAVKHEDTIERSLRFGGGAVHTLDVQVINGSIQVIGDNQSDVRVRIVRTIEAEGEPFVDDARRNVQLDMTDGADTVGLVVRQPHNVACGESSTVRREAWWDRPRYRVTTDVTVHVPAATRFRVCGINSKSVDVAGVTGDFDVTNVNGPVTLTGLRGSGRAMTVNGAVNVTFLDPPHDESLLKTINGDVTATFPASLSADLRLKTSHGGLFTDFDVTPVTAERSVAPNRRDGRYVYRSGGFTLVRAGRGGPEITLQTLNGDVRVIRAAR